MKIGVLALQGDFREHLEILHSIGVNPVAVKSKEALDIVDGLIIPGGESTTIGKIMKEMGLFDDLKKKIEDGLPVFGTCAGMIVLAKNISGFPDQVRLEAIDITVERNSYGRQIESFETDIRIPVLGDKPFRAVFIRAPKVVEMGKEVEVLAYFNKDPVLLKQKNVLVCSFHPELTIDSRIHRYFLEMVRG